MGLSIFSSTSAYIADISSPRWRTLRLSILETSVAFGRGIGVLGGGLWLESINCNFVPLMVFYTSIYAFIMLYTLVMPSSLTRHEREQLRQTVTNKSSKLRTAVEGCHLYCGGLSWRTTWKLYAITIVYVLFVFNLVGISLIDTYFMKAFPFDFLPSEIGYFEAAKYFVQGILNLMLVGILALVEVPDIWIIIVPLLFHITCNILIGFSIKPWQLFTSKGESCMPHLNDRELF